MNFVLRALIQTQWLGWEPGILNDEGGKPRGRAGAH